MTNSVNENRTSLPTATILPCAAIAVAVELTGSLYLSFPFSVTRTPFVEAMKTVDPETAIPFGCPPVGVGAGLNET